MKDAKYNNMRDQVLKQNFVPFDQTDILADVTFYVRTIRDPAQMFGVVRRVVGELDRNMPIFARRTLDVQVDQALIAERLIAFLAAIFGGLATLLAAVGLYGVMAYNVGRRTREIGIRMALGARGTSVMWLVMKEVPVLRAPESPLRCRQHGAFTIGGEPALRHHAQRPIEHRGGDRNHRARGGIGRIRPGIPRDPYRSHPRPAV